LAHVRQETPDWPGEPHYDHQENDVFKPAHKKTELRRGNREEGIGNRRKAKTIAVFQLLVCCSQSPNLSSEFSVPCSLFPVPSPNF
jgi:hypothetical protein